MRISSSSTIQLFPSTSLNAATVMDFRIGQRNSANE
jgi:hypothetical protein